MSYAEILEDLIGLDQDISAEEALRQASELEELGYAQSCIRTWLGHALQMCI